MTISNRLKTLSRACAVLCRTAAIALPIGAGGLWLMDGLQALLPLIGTEGDHRLASRMAGATLVLVPAFIAAGGLWHLATAFRQFAGGAVFSPEATNAIRGFAWTLVALAALDAVSRTGRALLGDWNHMPGAVAALPPVDVRTWAFLVVAVFLTVIAQALVEGARLSDDSRSII